MAKKKKVSEAKEIIYNIVNSLLAGGLVFLGAFSSGPITWQSIGLAAIAAGAVALTQFKNYWDGEKQEYASKVFNFANAV